MIKVKGFFFFFNVKAKRDLSIMITFSNAIDSSRKPDNMTLISLLTYQNVGKIGINH